MVKNFIDIYTFCIAEQGKRYFVIGCYNGNNALNIEVYDDNKLRVWINGYQKFYGEIFAEEDVVFTFRWDADAHTYYLSAKGVQTNIEESCNIIESTEYKLNMSGKKCSQAFRIGTADYREGAPVFNNITVKSLQITTDVCFGHNLTHLSDIIQSGSTFNSWSATKVGNTAAPMTMPSADTTIYAQWTKDSQ